METDLSNKCRACLKDDEEKRNIFEEFDDGITLLDMFKSTTCFEINKHDGLSHFMCRNCTNIVVDFYNFKKIYQINEEKQIKTLLLSRVKVPNENCDTEKENVIEKEESVFPETVHNTCVGYIGQHPEEKCDYNSDTGGENSEDKADHEIDEESKMIHNCLRCNKTFFSNEDLEEHLTSEHKKNLRNTKTFRACNNPKKPAQKTNPEDLYCKTCDRTFASDEDYKEHMKCHKPNVCLICGTGFAKKWDLTEHLDVHLVERTHVCGFCKKAFQRKTVLSKHRRICPKKPAKTEAKPPKDLFCKICNKTFDRIKDCKEHNAKLHKTFICHICGQSFAKKWDLKEHTDVHLDQRTHVCEFCNKTFQRKSVLVKHRKLHTHPLKELCTMCGKSFTYRSDLKLHIKLIHSKIRDLPCTICGAKFNVRSNLKNHVKRHQERQKDFHCEECPSEYKDKGSLKRHVQERHSESFIKPVCNICGKQFTCPAHLNRHLKNVHKK